MSQSSGPSRRSLLKLGGGGAAAAVLASLVPTSAAAARVPGSTSADSLPRSTSGRRKLVSYGWDFPGPLFLRDHITAMEQQPFDGVVFNLYENKWLSGEITSTAGGGPFATTINPFNPAALTHQDIGFDVLRSIRWNRFTDNFLSLWSGFPYVSMNWFDDTQWRTIRANLRLLAEAIAAAQATGVFFDHEDYGGAQWAYTSARYPGKTYEQVAAQARQRGREFVASLRSVQPNIKIMMAEGTSGARYFAEYFGSIGSPADSPYATFLPFLDGMYTGLGPAATIIDGDEFDYYYDESTKWFNHASYDRAAADLYSLAARPGYARTSMGSCVYVDLALGHKPGQAFTPSYYGQLSSADFQAWYQHNIYHAMSKADEYVWIYNENMQWWQPGQQFAGAAAGIVAARTAFDNGQALGYDLVKTTGYTDQNTRPAVVSAPTLQLSGAANGSRVPAGSSVTVTATPSAAVQVVRFYDNGRLIDTSMFGAPYTTGIVATRGAHTLFARAFLDDGSHFTSNPIVVLA